MPTTKSAEKQMRVAQRRQLRNKAVRTQCKTNIRKAEELVSSGKLDEAQGVVTAAISSLDKAAQKGVIHPSNAARRKSRLLKKLNKALAEDSAK